MDNSHDYSSSCVPAVVPPSVDPSLVDFREFYPYIPNEIKHRKRTTQAQLEVLEQTFAHDKKPNGVMRANLARELDMTPRGVQASSQTLTRSPQIYHHSDLFIAANSQVWFQNRCALTSHPLIPFDRCSLFRVGGRKKRHWPRKLPLNFNRHQLTLRTRKRL